MAHSPILVFAAPVLAALSPFLQAVAAAVASGAVTLALAMFARWTGVTINAAHADSLRKAAQTEAGVLVAEAVDDLASRSVPTNSPAVAAAAERIATTLPDAIKALGMTPDALARLVAGEIGKLQAQTTAIATPAAHGPKTP